MSHCVFYTKLNQNRLGYRPWCICDIFILARTDDICGWFFSNSFLFFFFGCWQTMCWRLFRMWVSEIQYISHYECLSGLMTPCTRVHGCCGRNGWNNTHHIHRTMAMAIGLTVILFHHMFEDSSEQNDEKLIKWFFFVFFIFFFFFNLNYLHLGAKQNNKTKQQHKYQALLLYN